MKDLLIEIGVEELPARFIQPAINQFSQTLTEQLAAQRIAFGQVQLFSTPRRLACVIQDVALVQKDLEEDVKGPPEKIAFNNGEPTKAAIGFAKSQGMQVDDLAIKQLDGVGYLFAHRFQKGQETKTVLTNILPGIIHGLNFPKNMRWGDYDLRYARPLRWIIALLGQDIVPFQVETVKSNRTSYGHRQLSKGAISIPDVQSYLDLLEEGYVIADHQRRKECISRQVQVLAKQAGGAALLDEALLLEVTNLVEYPTAFCGSFDAKYLEVPKDVLVTSMKEHQRYFPVLDGNGRLLPLFIGVRNGADNQLQLVTSGNEKVLRARLADAKFFYDEDRKHKLDDNLEKLKTVVFQDRLGSVYEKVQRVKQNASALCDVLGYQEQKAQCERTALLAKCDLVSQMVFEFPELQGIMGAEYASLSGEETSVAQGIIDHYKPRFAGDTTPSQVTGIVVSLADRLDTLVGYFGLGKIPTGSQDPLALRRQAAGVIQILLQNNLRGSLEELVDIAMKGYSDLLEGKEEQIKQSLLGFLHGRLRVVLLDDGYRYDVVDAVLASNHSVIPDLRKRIDVLSDYRSNAQAEDLFTTFERCSNLASRAQEDTLNTDIFTESDRELVSQIEKVSPTLNTLLKQREYHQYLSELASLRQPIDTYFDSVMIMDKDEEVRKNRLSLLKRVTGFYRKYADFGMIVIDM